jgi:hypothetical protein
MRASRITGRVSKVLARGYGRFFRFTTPLTVPFPAPEVPSGLGRDFERVLSFILLRRSYQGCRKSYGGFRLNLR